MAAGRHGGVVGAPAAQPVHSALGQAVRWT
jgi:hypothetical protein